MLEPKFTEHPNYFQQVLEERKLEFALADLQYAEGCVAVPVQPKAAAVHSQRLAGCNVCLTLGRQLGLTVLPLSMCAASSKPSRDVQVPALPTCKAMGSGRE